MPEVKIWFKKYGEEILPKHPDLRIIGSNTVIRDGFFWIDEDNTKRTGVNIEEIRKIELEIK